MALRPAQLSLKLADPGTHDEQQRWCHGAAIAYLGGTLTLCLDKAVKEAVRIDTELHLALPPQATARQIRDRSEAWLRAEALSRLGQLLAQKSALMNQLSNKAVEQKTLGSKLLMAARQAPTLRLSFANRSHWAESEGSNTIRCSWRLIEQPLDIIEQVLNRALADSAFASTHGGNIGAGADLFAFA
jgi:predicted metal-dependent hydrolase